ncbi:pyruvate dehydrogenase (acetyl-transferring) E1 component subunit alpha [Cryobacterium sp. BB307]|uniref:pyruvate dehydrogenase (acetyl-transferring) E1 component subunit alpha n=1 Tax=Cryobacterium sp. BB307 TaxID=2716317 RepID=UPI001446451F|nr:pyruvate dehydrogenase (acetyl-transferring) E1 component subunit alpha [Cryobacterium sp. BB307]
MSLNVETKPTVGLPDPEPLRLIDDEGRAVRSSARQGFELPPVATLKELYRRMAIARRWDTQVTALTRQGRLATYPSALGQEACEIGTVLAMTEQDWLFPTYRDSIALMTRGIDPGELLQGFRGDWHSGWDPKKHRTSVQATPLATQALHAVGYATAAKLNGERIATVTFIGDGASSEGDTHEAFNFAGVWQAPTVFVVQNNQFAISVPLSKQTRARTLADRAIGYGIPGYYVDGNDAAAVYAVMSRAMERARRGDGPTIVECLTYRVEAHTNSDDPTRYRTADDVAIWKGKDPIERLERYLVSQDALSDADRDEITAEGERKAAATREAMSAEPVLDPMDLFAHVYVNERPSLVEQREFLKAEGNR